MQTIDLRVRQWQQSTFTKYSYREFSFLKGILLPATKFIKLPFLQLLDLESTLFCDYVIEKAYYLWKKYFSCF